MPLLYKHVNGLNDSMICTSFLDEAKEKKKKNLNFKPQIDFKNSQFSLKSVKINYETKATAKQLIGSFSKISLASPDL